MTRENIEGMREVILPFVKKKLLEINYENLGKSDAEEFERHFNEILDMALKALEQEPILNKIKQAREEIENLNLNDYGDNLYQFQAKCTEILDKLIAESGDKV